MNQVSKSLIPNNIIKLTRQTRKKISWTPEKQRVPSEKNKRIVFSLEYFGPISLPHMCIQLASKVIYAYYWSSHSMFCYYIQKIFLSYLEKVVPHFVWEFLITAALPNPLRYWEYTLTNYSLPKRENKIVLVDIVIWKLSNSGYLYILWIEI